MAATDTDLSGASNGAGVWPSNVLVLQRLLPSSIGSGFTKHSLDILPDRMVCWREEQASRAPLLIKNGYIDVPTAPGLGIEVDEDELKKHPYEPKSMTMWEAEAEGQDSVGCSMLSVVQRWIPGRVYIVGLGTSGRS